jgi:hypothetical protein
VSVRVLIAAAFLSGCQAASGVIVSVAPPAEAPMPAGAPAQTVLSDLATKTRPVETAPILANGFKAPGETLLAHESKASSLWSGRVFMARGKILDSRVAETPIRKASDETPEGWSRNGDTLTHANSGLKCPATFDYEEKDGDRQRILTLKEIVGYDDKDLDVACNYVGGGDTLITLYASYYPDMTLEDHAVAAVTAMRQNFPLKGVLPVISIEIEGKSGEPLEEPIAGAFDIGEIGGVPYKTSLWLVRAHGWHVKARATYAQEDLSSEVMAALMFTISWVNVDTKNRDHPVATGPEV